MIQVAKGQIWTNGHGNYVQIGDVTIFPGADGVSRRTLWLHDVTGDGVALGNQPTPIPLDASPANAGLPEQTCGFPGGWEQVTP